MNNISKKIVAIGGGLNGRIKSDGTYDPCKKPIYRKFLKTIENTRIFEQRFFQV